MRFLSNLLASTLGTLLALFLVFFLFFLFIFALAAATDTAPRVLNNSVLVVTLDGEIPEIAADDPFLRAFGTGPSLDLRDLTTGLEKAAVDDRISAVWVQLQGLRGSWATLQEVRTALERFKQSGKPVYASSDDYGMDEAAYFVASVADSVFAVPQAAFEFNGFYLASEFYQNLFEKVGVEPQVIRAGKYKSAAEPFQRTDLSPENEEQLSALLNSWNEVFLTAVSESRDLPVEKLQAHLQTSAIITARDAHEAGLLDGLLYRDQVIDLLKRHTGQDKEDKLREISATSYANVPASEAGLRRGNTGDIAIVYAVGAIVTGDTPDAIFGSETIGSESFNKAMRAAREDDRVKAVVLRVNSPGGSASASDAMWREISLTAQEKPLIVSMGDYAASGGYWISTPADTIVADPLTLTGSIGVFSVLFDASELLEDKVGITFDLIRTSPFADMFSGLRSLSARERALLETSTEQTYQAFLQNVAQGRGISTAQVDSIGQGRIWSGVQAKEVGLVDVLGDLNTAIDIAAERAGLEAGTYGTRILPRPKTLLEEMTSSMESRAKALFMRLTTTPAERALLRQASLVQQLVDMQGVVQARLPMHITID